MKSFRRHRRSESKITSESTLSNKRFSHRVMKDKRLINFSAHFCPVLLHHALKVLLLLLRHVARLQDPCVALHNKEIFFRRNDWL
jgi:hypothetical protein